MAMYKPSGSRPLLDPNLDRSADGTLQAPFALRPGLYHEDIKRTKEITKESHPKILLLFLDTKGEYGEKNG
jgi:hypothetical protein